MMIVLVLCIDIYIYEMKQKKSLPVEWHHLNSLELCLYAHTHIKLITKSFKIIQFLVQTKIPKKYGSGRRWWWGGE
jgi:hypothetical protein